MKNQNNIFRAALLILFVCTLSLSPRSFSAGTIEYLPKNLFIDLGKKVNPAVVNISTTQVIHAPRGYGFPVMPYPNDPFRQFFEDFMGQQGQGGPGGPGGPGGGQVPGNPYGGGGQGGPEEKVQSLGSGFIIEPTGLIVTNFHVIQNASEIQVQLTEKSKRTYKAKVVGSDKRTDIALIKITAEEKLPYVTLGDSDKVEMGEWVAAFGNPFGHGHSMTKGIISAKDRVIELESAYYPFLQTDASINPGNSGGPLVNTDGAVIGVNSAIDARAQGIGFAIPVNIVKKLLPTLKTKGRIIHGFLGVGINNIDDQIARQFNLKNQTGAIVLNVTPGSPAAKAGIRNYDVILSYNGKEIDSARSLTNMVAETPVGDMVTMILSREGKTLTVKAKITERPDEITHSAGKGDDDQEGEDESATIGRVAPFNLGMTVTDLSPQVTAQLGLHDVPNQGVVIVGVKQESLSEEAGLQVGDVILDINRKPVKSVKEAFKLFKKGSNNLRILRDGAAMIVFMEAK